MQKELEQVKKIFPEAKTKAYDENVIQVNKNLYIQNIQYGNYFITLSNDFMSCGDVDLIPYTDEDNFKGGTTLDFNKILAVLQAIKDCE